MSASKDKRVLIDGLFRSEVNEVEADSGWKFLNLESCSLIRRLVNPLISFGWSIFLLRQLDAWIGRSVVGVISCYLDTRMDVSEEDSAGWLSGRLTGWQAGSRSDLSFF